jgi:hypothetical protein
MNQTYDLPQNLGDLMGAYDEAHWETQVCEIKAAQGVLKRGTVLASGNGADVGKLVLLTPTTEVNAYGVLLDASVDTAAPYSDAARPALLRALAASRGAH